jgi:hypothetical protein
MSTVQITAPVGQALSLIVGASGNQYQPSSAGVYSIQSNDLKYFLDIGFSVVNATNLNTPLTRLKRLAGVARINNCRVNAVMSSPPTISQSQSAPAYSNGYLWGVQPKVRSTTTAARLERIPGSGSEHSMQRP